MVSPKKILQEVDAHWVFQHYTLPLYFWIVTLNAAGSMLDLKGFGGTHHDIFNSINEISKGSFVMAGSTDSDDGDVIGYTIKIPGTRDRDAWIMLY